MEKIGEKIRKIRTLNGFSQENMADMLNISLVSYGDIERCKTRLTSSRLEEIARALEVSVEDIETFDEKIAFIFKNSGNAFAGYNQTNHHYSDTNAQLELEKMRTQIELLKLEKEKADWEAKYWAEKCQKQTASNP